MSPSTFDDALGPSGKEGYCVVATNAGGVNVFGPSGSRRWVVLNCVEINHWFGGPPPNFRTLYIGQFEVESADFWTDRLLLSSSRSTAKESGPNRSITLTLKSG